MIGLFKNKYLAFVQAMIFLLLVGVGCKGTKSVPASENLGTVSKEDIIQRVTVAGTVTPNRKTLITAPYNAYVRKIYVKIGDHVKAGDPIVSLSQSLRSNEEIYPLRAPFDGTVVQILKTEGEYVEGASGGTNTLVRVDDLSKLLVEASVPEIDVSKLKIGQAVIVKASAVLNRTYEGIIHHIFLAAKEQKDWDKSRVEFTVLMQINNPDAEIKPGMSVIVDVVTQMVKQVLAIGNEFVQTKGKETFVVTDSGQKKNIELGLQNEELAEIKSGLREGERVRLVDFLNLPTGSGI